MGEMSKQVRVDNWGTFFLQRLQSFFNKTEHCDLTLQFEGNVQLKVHRLVLYACTEYFHILEQTCDISDDVLIMPPDLQADVIVPIINFMYTGMLEYQITMFDRLYQAATLMNITILTKLLDAQRKPYFIKSVTRKQQIDKKSPTHKPISNSHLPATLPGRKLPVWKRKVAPLHVPEPITPLIVKARAPAMPDPLAFYDNTPKPTRFEWPEEELSAFNPLDSTFDDISYTSRPLLTEEDELKACSEAKRNAMANKQSKAATSSSEIEDVTDYGKEQKIRLDFEDEESLDAELIPVETPKVKRKRDNVSPTSSTNSSASKRVRFILEGAGEKENKEKRVSITTTGKTNDMDHTKIISELLKKYPDLVKKNKNIRLKIMTKNASSPSSSTTVEKNSNTKSSPKVRVQLSPKQTVQKVIKVVPKEDSKKDEGPWMCNLCSNDDEKVEFVLYYLYRKHMTDVHNEKFDSRMCKFCGHKSNKHNMLMYHMYTKHGVKPPPAYNFPKCNQCHYIALTEALLIKHKLNHTRFELQCRECKVAFSSADALENHVQLTGHTGKYGRTNYDCQYCSKQYQSGANLFSHIKMQHREEAKSDGIVSIDEIEKDGIDDEEDDEDFTAGKQQIREEDEYITPEIIHETKTKEKFKILQNVKVSNVQQPQHQEQTQHAMTLEPSSEAEALSNVANGIATSLGLVDIVVLNENQQYILQSNEQLQNNQPEFILPELSTTQFTTQNQTITTSQSEIQGDHNVITQSMLNSGDIASTDELVMVLTDHDYGDGNNELITNDNSNIVVLYSHPVDGQENQFITTSQGNLMVNSQTGMIEIRNSGIATTTSNTIVVTQPTQDTQIESIEMIQQEINSQANTTIQQEEQQHEIEENEQQEEYVGTSEEQQHVEETSQHHEETVQEYTGMENSVENTKDGDNDVQMEHEHDEEQQEHEDGDNDVEMEHVQNDEEQQEQEHQPETEEAAEPSNTSAEQQEQETSQNEDYVPTVQDHEQELSAEPSQEMPASDESLENTEQQQNTMTVEEEPAPELIPQLLSETEVADEKPQDDNSGKDLEMPVLEEEQPTHTEDNTEAQEENNEETSQLQTVDEEENSQSSHSSMRQNEGSGEQVATTKISILDDWEDTDSQQSEKSRGNKSGNTVNKLMDDWADEEDDESKKNANT